ncbi:PDZ domain-containing protein [Akkermansiaceae bacterium]|nr:PDZ domain-containing protein [Akkermansiaceae bacterium]
MKTQSVLSFLGAIIAAFTLLPAVAQEKSKPEIRVIEFAESDGLRVEDMRKRIEERLKQADIDMSPEMRRELMKSLRRPAGDVPGDAKPRGEAPTKAPNEQPWMIGLMVEPVDDLLRTHLDLPKDVGVMVTRTVPGKPAAAAGIVPNDILLSAGDRKIAGIGDLRDAVQAAGKSGKPLKLAIIHEGKRREVSIDPDGPKPEQEKKDDKPSGGVERGQMLRPGVDAMQRHNRQMEEMGNQMRRMNQQIERQQKQIEMLEKRLAESNRNRPEPD